jgi:hypothetical protein
MGAVFWGYGNPACHYRLDWPAFSETFLNFLQVRSPKKSANETEKALETLNTEITTEITDIEKEGGAIAPPAPPFQKTEMKIISSQPARNTVFQKNLISETTGKVEHPAFWKNQPSETVRPATATTPKHPASETYRQVTGRYPPTAAEPLIQAAGIEAAADLQFWEQVIRHYIGTGWNRQNISAMLEFHGRRQLPGTRPGSKNFSGGQYSESFNQCCGRGNSLSPEQRRLFGVK